VAYWGCEECGFLFSRFLDKFSASAVAALIYNEDYLQVDPDYPDARPQRNAKWLQGLLHGSPSVLDYGCGNGKLVELMSGFGVERIAGEDPFSGSIGDPGVGRFDLVVAFEVLEHATDPIALASHLRSRLSDDGIIILSTHLLQEQCACPLNWRYVAPRNGHVSIFSRRSLERLAGRVGMAVRSLTATKHVLFGDAAHVRQWINWPNGLGEEIES